MTRYSPLVWLVVVLGMCDGTSILSLATSTPGSAREIAPGARRPDLARSNSPRLGMTADSITTQRFISRGQVEGDPFARPHVKHGWSGQIAAEGIEINTEIWSMYGLHRTINTGSREWRRPVWRSPMASSHTQMTEDPRNAILRRKHGAIEPQSSRANSRAKEQGRSERAAQGWISLGRSGGRG